MTQNFHTPIEFAAPATSLVFNTRFGQLDSVITDLLAGDQPFTQLNFGTTTNLVIVSDAISISRSRHTISPQAGITDDLKTINGFAQGDILYLKLQNSGDSITIKHNTGNIFLSTGADLVLNDHRKTVALMYDQTVSRWMDIPGASPIANGALTFPEISAPSTPSAATAVLYAKSDGRLYSKDDGGVEYGPFGSMGAITPRTVLGGSAANIDITSIPAVYKALLLVLELRSDRAADNDDAVVSFNGDTTAGNYYTMSTRVNHSASLATNERLGAVVGGIDVFLGTTGATSTANWRGSLQLWIYGYAESSLPRRVSYQGATLRTTSTGLLTVISGGGLWTNVAAAINQITITPLTGTNWVANSAYALYGVG